MPRDGSLGFDTGSEDISPELRESVKEFRVDPNAEDTRFDFGLVPRTKADWITTAAPLVAEALAVAAPEVTLPVIGAVDLARAFQLMTSSMVGRTALSAAVGAIANKMTGRNSLEGAAAGGLGNLAGEGVGGIVKGAGRLVGGGMRKMVLGRSSRKLASVIGEGLPAVNGELRSTKDPAAAMKRLFRRATQGGRSAVEKHYGGELGNTEDTIDRTLTSRGPLKGFNAKGQAVRYTRKTLFPVHVIDANGDWQIEQKPFKEAVAIMRDKYPRGYRISGTERDAMVAAEWRRMRQADSQNIGKTLATANPQLAEQWQTARKKWELAHVYSNILSDPKSYDPISGQVNTEHIDRHLEGETPNKISEYEQLQRIVDPNYAAKVKGAVIHVRPQEGKDLPVVRDIVGIPESGGTSIGVGISPWGVHPHVQPHAGSAAFRPAVVRGTSSTLPWVTEKPAANPLIGLLRALGRHAGVETTDVFGQGQ